MRALYGKHISNILRWSRYMVVIEGWIEDIQHLKMLVLQCDYWYDDPGQSAISKGSGVLCEMEFEILETQEWCKNTLPRRVKTSFSFYCITENILKVTSTAMKLRVMEFYIHFYIHQSGIKISWWWQCNLNISSLRQ